MIDVFYEILGIVEHPAFELDPSRAHAGAPPVAERAFRASQNPGGLFGVDESG